MKRQFLSAFAFCALILLGFSCKNSVKSPMTKPVVSDERLEGLVAAPEFPKLEWLNTDKPLSIAGLKGKIVILDFWTYCCINCMHVLPDLKKLEEKYPNELVVVGVHSAKFENERGTDSIRSAIMRYGIHHPVINDYQMEVWQAYAVHSWPTLVVLNPRGRIIGVTSGEDVFDLLDGIVSTAIDYFSKKGELVRGPLNLALEEAKRPQKTLNFPGKISADPAGKRLFITDSNHHRILIADPSGKVTQVIGSGEPGKADGAFDKAQLNHPQGTFLSGDFLYIADTENHLIRRADLQTKEVTTLFGTGEKARQYNLKGKGTEVPLNSPWDLLEYDGKLYIAMAGPHQIYVADLKTMEIKPYAGSGQEARLDGPLLSAALAQPSGITTDGTKLYFADSETSSIRSADLALNGKVETIIGEDLFEFGDIDGSRRVARLQHALGVVYNPAAKILYVADTYNSKIKIIDPLKMTSKTLAGTGKHGLADGSFDQAQFFEPGGLALLEDKLYVADTNNHEIRVLDLKAGQVTTLKLEVPATAPKRTLLSGREVELAGQTLKQGKGAVKLNFKLPAGYHFNHDAPMHVEWKSEMETALRFTSMTNSMTSEKLEFPLQIPILATAGKSRLSFKATIYYCSDQSKICLIDNVTAKVPVEVVPTGSSMLELSVDIPPKG